VTSIAWLLALPFAWTFVLYPALSFALSLRARERRGQRRVPASPLPPAALIIAARNEAGVIAGRIDDARRQSYGGQLLVVVASDGSSDGTADVARRAGADLVVECTAHVGKSRAIEAAIDAIPADVELLLFTDATARWSEGSARALATTLMAPEVGAVSGLVRYDYPTSTLARGFSVYQRLIVAHRQHDADWGTLTSVSGSISGVRRALWQTAPPELSSDLVVPLMAARAGLKAAMVREAVSVEVARARASREFGSRVRMAMSAFAFTRFAFGPPSPALPVYRFQLLSHKVLRWFAPVGLPPCLVWWASEVPVASAVVLGATLLIVALSPRARSAATFAATVAAAYAVGLVRVLLGHRPVGWDPDSQR
jgi:cellulose synthase/poly-beta-1,6-N-acetylglucosamine synthase-like glycosyltransferase